MKPSDFYVGSRQLFGFLVPGTVWVVTATLVFLTTKPDELLRTAATANVVEGLSFLAFALIIGMLMQWPSYAFAKRFSRSVRILQNDSLLQRFSRYLRRQRNKRRSGDRHDRIVWMCAHRLLRSKYRTSVPQLMVMKAQTPELRIQRERLMFTACKRAVLVKSPTLSKRLLEAEDEINLVGMLPLPILFFGIAIVSHSSEILSSFPLASPPFLSWPVLMIIALLITEYRLLRRFHLLRIEEHRSCFQIFLMIEGGLVPATADQQGPSALVRASE